MIENANAFHTHAIPAVLNQVHGAGSLATFKIVYATVWNYERIPIRITQDAFWRKRERECILQTSRKRTTYAVKETELLLWGHGLPSFSQRAPQTQPLPNHTPPLPMEFLPAGSHIIAHQFTSACSADRSRPACTSHPLETFPP